MRELEGAERFIRKYAWTPALLKTIITPPLVCTYCHHYSPANIFDL